MHAIFKETQFYSHYERYIYYIFNAIIFFTFKLADVSVTVMPIVTFPHYITGRGCDNHSWYGVGSIAWPLAAFSCVVVFRLYDALELSFVIIIAWEGKTDSPSN